MFECKAAIETFKKIHPVQFNTGWVQVVEMWLLFCLGAATLYLLTYIRIITQSPPRDLQNQIGRAYLELGNFEHARQGRYQVKCDPYFVLFFFPLCHS